MEPNKQSYTVRIDEHTTKTVVPLDYKLPDESYLAYLYNNPDDPYLELVSNTSNKMELPTKYRSHIGKIMRKSEWEQLGLNPQWINKGKKGQLRHWTYIIRQGSMVCYFDEITEYGDPKKLKQTHDYLQNKK